MAAVVSEVDSAGAFVVVSALPGAPSPELAQAVPSSAMNATPTASVPRRTLCFLVGGSVRTARRMGS
ncbi:MAG TPA: hypothetical protein VGP26_22950 [Actinophytocola sp.]|jgi:hypothetical protein|nr:hypothetical protein [Actinophytocola sp.]